MVSGQSKRKLKDTSPAETGRPMMKNLMRTPTSTKQRQSTQHDNGGEGTINAHSSSQARGLQQGDDDLAGNRADRREEGGRRSGREREGENAMEDIAAASGKEDEEEVTGPDQGGDNGMMAFLKQFKKDMLRSSKKVEDRIAESEVRI